MSGRCRNRGSDLTGDRLTPQGLAAIAVFDSATLPLVEGSPRLGVVIGTRPRYVPQAEALSHVAGYCLVHDVSERAYQLEPGDIITTGTPKGVGMGQTPPTYLRAGQTVRLGIDGLGEQTQRFVAAA